MIKKLVMTNELCDEIIRNVYTTSAVISKVVLENVHFDDTSDEGWSNLMNIIGDGVKSLEISFSTRYPPSIFLIALESLGDKIHNINFRYSSVTDDSVDQFIRILESGTLKTIDITCTQFTTQGLKKIIGALSTTKGMKYLSIGGNNFTGEDYSEAVNSILNGNCELKALALTDVALEAYSSLRSILLNIKYNHQLSQLDLSRTNMKVEGMKILTTMLAEKSSLEEINLSGNKLSVESIELLQTALSFNANMKKLTMRRCFLSQKDEPKVIPGEELTEEPSTEISLAFSELVELIKENETLTALDLRDNALGPNHIQLLSNALKNNNNITSLDISKNKITGKGINFLSSAIIKNTSLKVLDLRGIEFDDLSANSLLWALGWNNTMQEILFGSSPSKLIKDMINLELDEKSNKVIAESQKATTDDIDAIVELIVMNNSNSNPRFIHMVPDEEKRTKVCRRLVKTSVKWCQKYDSAYIVQMKNEAGGQILGTTVWVPPGVKLEAPMVTFLKSSMKTLVEVGVKSVSRIKTVVNGVEDFTNINAPETCWKLLYFEVVDYFYDLHVVWEMMFSEVLNSADRDAYPIFTYCNKEESVRVLEFLDFEIIREGIIDEAVPIWGMVRQPKIQ